MNSKPARAWTLFALVLVGATASPAGQAAAPKPLPELGKREIAGQLDRLLRDLGNLGAYIYSVDDSGEGGSGQIDIKTFAVDSACVTLPVPTLMKAGVDTARLDQLLRALEVFDQGLAQGVTPPLHGVTTACLPPPPGGKTLPNLTPDQIRQQLTEMLARVGDLSAYFVDPGPGGSIVIKDFAFRHKCATLPPPLRSGQPMPKDGFTPLESAVRAVNAARLAGSRAQVPMKAVRARCLPTKVGST